jgi:hypothetical protein
MAFRFANLLVLKIDFSDEVCQLTSNFDRGNSFPAFRLNHAAHSINTNLTAGNDHLSTLMWTPSFDVTASQSKSVRKPNCNSPALDHF